MTAENMEVDQTLLEKLVTGLRNQEEILEGVRKLRRRDKAYMIFTVVLVVLLVVVVLGMLSNRDAIRTAKDAAAEAQRSANQVTKVVENDQAQDARQEVNTCRIRNELDRRIFRQFRSAYLSVYKLGPPSIERRQSIQVLIDDIRDPVRRDCDGNGERGDEGDYP